MAGCARQSPQSVTDDPQASASSPSDPGSPAATESTGDDEKEGKEEEQTIAEIIEDHDSQEGLFTFFRDPEDGSTHLKVAAGQLGKDFIYFSVTESGLVDVRQFRGRYHSSYIFRIQRHFDRLDFYRINQSFFYDSENPLKRAADANINKPLIASVKIEAEDEENGDMLVKADDLFKSEAFQMVSYPRDPESTDKNPFVIGKLSSEKTRLRNLRVYPENAIIDVDYVFENPDPTNFGDESVTDARYITVSYQHHWIEAPENDYQPREDDPRVGYFLLEKTDMTSTSETPYRDVIQRWHLVKKEPEAALSEPVEPIVWWIENTTPHEFRESIREGALAWNEAFEAAGFKNAIQVKIQPDDAEWDAGDLRYNVLRWTSSPNPPFGGYGPSLEDPRTGQILGADIMLEYVFITNRVWYGKVFETAGLDLMDGDRHLHHDPHLCHYAEGLHRELMAGKAILSANGASEIQMDRLIQETLKSLILHEIGHTLGLSHNFRSSHTFDPVEIHDPEVTQGRPAASVMEYDPLNLAPVGRDHGDFTNFRPGLYDIWAIQYGYTPSLDDPAAEQERVRQLLSMSTDPVYQLAIDSDAMRGNRGIDPRAMVFDMSTDPIQYSVDRMELILNSMDNLKGRLLDTGEFYQEILNGYLTLTSQYQAQTSIIAKHIGGVYVDRTAYGDDSGAPPFLPVPYDQQKRAMKVLSDYLFSPGLFQGARDLYPFLQAQRRGWNYETPTEDPKIHDRLLNMQAAALTHLTGEITLRRMADTSLYGNAYPVAELFQDLTDASFLADAEGDVNSIRQNLQVSLLERFISIFESDSMPSQAKAASLMQLKRIREQLAGVPEDLSLSTQAHRELLLFKIDDALEPNS